MSAARLHILLAATAALALSACSAEKIEQNWINRVAGNTKTYVQGTGYNVSYLPLASPPGDAAQAWVFGPGVSAPFVIMDSGVPGLQITRMDGQPMTRADHGTALAAANAGCADRPGWTTAKATALVSTFAAQDQNRYKGTAYLYNGAWTLMGVCE